MKNIYKKLLEIQQEIGSIKKDSVNPFFSSKYFDINALLNEVKPILNKHGVIVLQPLNALSLKTLLIDTESGESVESEATLPQNPDPQKMGAIISYFRRYSLTSLLALEAEDTDANDTAVAQVTKNVVDNSKIPETVVGGGTKIVEETLCSECGNVMIYKSGMKNGKEWKGMFCPTKGHQPIWL